MADKSLLCLDNRSDRRCCMMTFCADDEQVGAPINSFHRERKCGREASLSIVESCGEMFASRKTPLLTCAVRCVAVAMCLQSEES